MRAFVGIPVPSPACQVLYDRLEEMRERYPDVKWTVPENFHVTVLFLGEVSDEGIPRIRTLLDSLPRLASNTAKAVAIAQFPRKGSPKIIVAALGPGAAMCTRIHDLAAAVLPEYSDRRRYVPHVTLGRVRKGRRVAPVDGTSLALNIPFEVSSLVLYESVLKSGGPVYHPIHCVDFS